MTRRLLALAGAAAFVLAGATAAGGGEASHEVWAIDQSDSVADGGGRLYIYSGEDLAGAGSADAAAAEVIDLGGAARTLCLAETGTAPRRPHMVFFNAAQTHAVISFVATGHVLFLDAPTRTPLACIDVGAQAHAAVPSRDQSYALVANQNGKLLQRIRTDYATNTFMLENAATLNLATCTTPSRAPCQDPVLRPDNAPICPLIDSTSTFAFVTLRGGGHLVVDATATPMRIVAEYDRTTVHGNGCGGLETGGKMYVNSGGGTATNLSEFDVYAFRLSEFSTTPSGQPNKPPPTLVVSQDDRADTDSHGMALTKHDRLLWVADRSGNRVVVIDTATDTLVGEFSLVGGLSADPSPDLFGLAPAGNRMYVTLRGPTPLTGDPHASTGSTPGVGVIRVEAGGSTGTLQAIARISNRDVGGVERADPHGIGVRRR
jgi:DNA-binding beta-propeller fold protein YncE